jgi:hypothetical protein
MEYDSTKPDVGVYNPFASTYSAMIGKSFNIRVTPKGKMIGLNGIDQMYLQMAQKIVENEDESIRKGMREKYGEVFEERAQQAIDRLDQRYGSRSEREKAVKDLIVKNPLFSKSKIEGMVGNVILSFPGGPVKVSESWKGGAVLPAAAPVDIELTYTLKEKKQDVLIIDIDSSIDLFEVPAPGPVGPEGPTKVSLKGSYKGSGEIDPATGWMLHKKATMKCSGRMEIAAVAQRQSMPISMESITTVETID